MRGVAVIFEDTEESEIEELHNLGVRGARCNALFRGGTASDVSALADMAKSPSSAAIRAEADREWRGQGFFRLLNRMLFLAGRADQRWSVMQRFYHLRAPLIAR